TCREVPRGEGVRWGGRADRSPVSRVSEIGTHGLNGGSDSGSPWLQWSKVLPMCRPLERNSCTICRSGLLKLSSVCRMPRPLRYPRYVYMTCSVTCVYEYQ